MAHKTARDRAGLGQGGEDLPWQSQVLVERLKHYFSTYKLIPGQEKSIWIENLYGRDPALEVANAAMEDSLDLAK